MHESILNYNDSKDAIMQAIMHLLATTIIKQIPEATYKIWHAHPVWFLNDNPIVGYSLQKKGCRLMFWSGKSFEDDKLNVLGGKFQDASIFYNSVQEINITNLIDWLQKAKTIQWDYKNIVKRKGLLVRLS